MAGDWIKMRVDLMDDPSVVAIAVRLEMDEDHVVGKLHRLWSWADRHTIDGATSGVNDTWVDRFVAKKGFAAAMADVGWLVIGTDGIRFPGFEKHNGESAKKRADAQQRQRVSRQGRHTSVTKMSRDAVPSPFRRTVFNRDQYTCVYCGTESSEIREKEEKKARLSIDHILPVARGGKTVVENLATCCRACNYEKSDRTPEEWDLLPTFLADGVVYENGHIVVTKQCDTTVTREEKRREEDTAIAVSVCDTKPKRTPSRGFVAPTVEEVRAYCTERGNAVDPERFVDHYAARGWVMSNGRKVKDWQACVRTWEKNDEERRGHGNAVAIRPAGGNRPVGGFATREQQREAANHDAIAAFLHEAGVREGDAGADDAKAHGGLHQTTAKRLVLRSEAIPGQDDQSGGRGASNVGNAISGGLRPIPAVSPEDTSTLFPDVGG